MVGEANIFLDFAENQYFVLCMPWTHGFRIKTSEYHINAHSIIPVLNLDHSRFSILGQPPRLCCCSTLIARVVLLEYPDHITHRGNRC